VTSSPTKMPLPYLPVELYIQIFSCIPWRDRQKALAAVCLVSRFWYNASIELLYHCPSLFQGDLRPFLQLVCDPLFMVQRPIENHIGVGDYVRRLDVGNLVHDGTMYTIGSLLKATKAHLNEFVAPTGVFRYVYIPTLS
jgi:hypothetical protein